MAEPVARIKDNDACPLRGHGANATCTGSTSILVNGRPAVRMGDATQCGDTVTGGSSNTFANNRQLAHVGSPTAHGGTIVTGSHDVLVGSPDDQSDNTFDEQFILVDTDGHPLANISYKIIMADGRVVRGKTDENGHTERMPTSGPEPLALEPDIDDAELTSIAEDKED